MSRLPALSWKEILRKLHKIGYEVIRQKGSHMTLKSQGMEFRKPITLPKHRIVGRGLLRKILRDIRIEPDEFEKL